MEGIGLEGSGSAGVVRDVLDRPGADWQEWTGGTGWDWSVAERMGSAGADAKGLDGSGMDGSGLTVSFFKEFHIMLSEGAVAQLQVLLDSKGGIIKPADVLALADADHESPLGQLFEWKDAVAGEKYRLAQARQIIRVWRFRPSPMSTETRRATASLPSDRQRGGGYRHMNQIETVSALRMERLLLALNSVETACRSHMFLEEVAPTLTTVVQLIESQRSKLIAEGSKLDAKPQVG